MAQTFDLTSNPAGASQDFGSVKVGATSIANAYILNGTGFVNNVTLNIPAQFEGSIDNVTFKSSLSVTPVSGAITNQPVYLRFKPTLVGPVSDFFDASTRTANGRLVSSPTSFNVTGTGAPGPPTITVNPAALGFGNQITNTTSSPMSVTVTGTSLTADITVSAPTDFLVSSDGLTYGATATLAQTNGSVSATLRVEFSPKSIQGYVSTVSLVSGSGSGMATQTVSVSGVGIAPTPVLNVSPN